MRSILDFMNNAGTPPIQEEQPDMVQSILSKRFQPDLEDASRAALQNFQSMAYGQPSALSGQDFADQRISQALQQLQVAAALQNSTKNDLAEKMAFERFQNTDPEILAGKERVARAGANLTPMAVYDPATGQQTYVPKSDVTNGRYMPPPPSGYKYGLNNKLFPTQPPVRDQMRLQKSVESASAASNVERLSTEAQEIFGRYSTSKAAPILGKVGQWGAAMGIGNDQEIKDFERLNKISNEFGTMTLQQFGGNDTEKELQVAIQSNIDPGGIVSSNLETIRRKLLAAQILQQRPIFEEEWLNNAGSLTSPDPSTGQTFSRAWMDLQRSLWNDGLKRTMTEENVPTGKSILPQITPEQAAAELVRRRGMQ